RAVLVRRVPRGGGGVPGVRERGDGGPVPARGRGVPGEHQPRDDGGLARRAGRAVRVGALFYAGGRVRDGAVHAILRREQCAVSVRAGEDVPRARADPAELELQLRGGRRRARGAAAGDAGAGRDGRGDRVPHGAVVLDDGAAAEAVGARRDGGQLDADRGG